MTAQNQTSGPVHLGSQAHQLGLDPRGRVDGRRPVRLPLSAPLPRGVVTILCPQCFTEAWEQATGLSVAWELRVHPDTLTAAERRRREASPDCHGRICRGDPCPEVDR